MQFCCFKYLGKPDSLVEHRIEHGDRPDVSLCLKEEKEKKAAVTELMKHCWKQKPSDRPDFNGMSRFVMERRMCIDSLSYWTKIFMLIC